MTTLTEVMSERVWSFPRFYKVKSARKMRLKFMDTQNAKLHSNRALIQMKFGMLIKNLIVSKF